MTGFAAADGRPIEQTRDRIYYGWVVLVVAAVGMVATLPGRTQGLGLITEPLLRDLHGAHLDFAVMNFWATLIGSAFCLGCGPLIDRLGARVVLTGVLAALGVTLLAMSRIAGPRGLLATLTLTRGFGQSALSVVSLAIVGKWFVRKLPVAMGVYSFLIGAGFVAAFPGVGYAVMQFGWRPVWWWMGWALLAGLAPLAWLLVRPTPESAGLTVDGLPPRGLGAAPPPTQGTHFSTGAGPSPGPHSASDSSIPHEPGLTLQQTLRTLAFWAFALSGAAFGLVSSGLMLFNEAVLRERGFDSGTVLIVLAVITFTAMLANFAGGWLAQRWPIGRLMGAAMFLLAVALLTLPMARGRAVAYGYAAAMGVAAGIVTVVFFVCWGKVFGRAHLGAVQGAAQLLTVLASATGPWLLAKCLELTGSSTPLLFALSPIVAALGVLCLIAPLPRGEIAESNR